MTFRNYRDKEVVFSQGDPADSVFYVESGTVKLTAVTTRKKAIIAILQQGSFFGEGCLAGQSRRICTARSIGQSNVVRLQKERTIRTLNRDPHFATLFVGYLLSRVVESSKTDRSILQFQRVAGVFLCCLGNSKGTKFDPP
jgi:CRP-like cAMP-binding protein